MDISLLQLPDGWEPHRETEAEAENIFRALGIPAHLLYAVPTIIDGRIVEISLVRKPADPHVPPIEPIG